MASAAADTDDPPVPASGSMFSGDASTPTTRSPPGFAAGSPPEVEAAFTVVVEASTVCCVSLPLQLAARSEAAASMTIRA